MKQYLLTLLIGLFPVYAFAIYPTVKNFSHKESRSGNQNWSIIQHKNDWMYFANNHGLLEYDGNKWCIYPIDNYTDVRSLHYDEKTDRIYAGAFNEFGYYSRNEAGILQYNSLKNEIAEEDRNFNEIWGIYQLGDVLYFQGDREVFRYMDGKMKRFSFANKINYSSSVYNLFIVSVMNEGIFILNGDIFIPLPNSEILRDKRVCAILPIHDNKILFITDIEGMYIFDGEKTNVYKTDIDDFLKENQVFCAATTENRLAIGTVRSGLVVKNLKTGENIFSNIYSGMQNNTILSIMFDRQENLWLGLDRGIDYVVINSPIYDMLGNNQLYGSGYTSLVKNNSLYLGTNQGLYITEFPIKSTPELLNIKLVPNIQGQIWSLNLIDNKIFCGGNQGAFIIHDNKIKQIPELAGTWNFKELKKHPGHILGCSYQGLFILKKVQQEWKFSHYLKGFSEAGGLFDEDENGDIWFSHWIKGIYKLSLNDRLDSVSVKIYDTDKGFHTNRNNTFSKIDNRMIFSSDGGFFEYDATQDRMVHSEKMETIFGIFPFSTRFFESPEGDIWCVSKSFFDVALKQADGTYNRNSAFAPVRNKLVGGFEHIYFVNNENIIVSTEDGFSWLQMPDSTYTANDTLKVAIRNIYLTNEHDSIVSGYIENQRTIPEFEHKHNSVKFEFIATDFQENETILYSYMLENYDVDWSVYSTTNTKEYTKLPRGTYTFKVRAKKESDETATETTYTFTILPAWYESKIAFIIYLVLLVLFILILTLYIRKISEKGIQAIREEKEKEMKEQEIQFKQIEQEKEKEIMELKTQRLQYDLRHKSRELASSTMNLMRKNEILLEINDSLGKISSDLKSSGDSQSIQKHLTKMQNEIKQNIERDDNWKKFEEHFDMVYENYLKSLGEKYPSLTVSDKKLCAYLKMGLSSKEIAPLLNMSYRSVEMSRYRLRKKLDLDREVNLTDFLQHFKGEEEN